MIKSTTGMTGRTWMSMLALVGLLLYAFAAPVFADHTEALGASGTENESDFSCSGDYFKIETIGQLDLGTHNYTGTTKNGAAWSANLTLEQVGEPGDLRYKLTVNSMTPSNVSIFVKTGGGNFTETDNSVGPFENDISHVAFCLGTAASPSPSPSPAATPTPSPSPSPAASPNPSPSPSPAASPNPSPSPSPAASPNPSPSPAASPNPSPAATPTPPDTAGLPGSTTGGGDTGLLVVLVAAALAGAALLLRPTATRVTAPSGQGGTVEPTNSRMSRQGTISGAIARRYHRRR